MLLKSASLEPGLNATDDTVVHASNWLINLTWEVFLVIHWEFFIVDHQK